MRDARASENERRAWLLWWAQQGAMVAAAALALFGAAGRLGWGAGWLQVTLMAAAVLGQAAALSRWQPALVTARVRPLEGGQRGDWLLAFTAAVLLPLLTCAVAGLEERAAAPATLSGVGRGVAAGVQGLGYTLFTWAMTCNPFFAATVGIQVGHGVTGSGPYRWLRHPGYAGAILVQVARPLMLASHGAWLPALLSVGLYLVRVLREERVLREGLAGYSAYTRAVRWRLLPGVW